MPTSNTQNMSFGFVGNPSLPMSLEGMKAAKEKQKDDEELGIIQHKTTSIKPYPLQKVEEVPPWIEQTRLGEYVDISCLFIHSLYIYRFKTKCQSNLSIFT